MSRLKTWLQEMTARAFWVVRRQHQLVLHRRDVQSGRLVMGKHTYGVPEVHHYKGSEGRVLIGNYCSIAQGVIFITGGIHPLDWVSTFPFRVAWNLDGQLKDGTPATRGDIRVGSDVWIGTAAMIMSGVQIGDGAVVCARAVVTKNVPPYAMVGGVPARVLRFRFNEEVIRSLLDLRWWEWPEDKVKNAIPLLSGPSVQCFLDHFTNTAYEREE